ncbi:hypothetical protein HELRODRAFT_103807 [Helobdella robusta]|uniref:V-type proton ATPase subunit C n=1 Tax=Helobdella robusta TaxID=6412 RepID=T1EDH6_HELRO|nr:hypothetical protein HELRODRAFT_103807 [Helobdella robusta]ESN92328.1 hypothetical protein HELRODRAFT_103807 [Helobdella robusta]
MEMLDSKLKDITEFWLISAPGEKTCAQTWENMNNVTSKQNNLSINFKFHIPDLKVGTLDVLVGLSDDLAKLDGYVEIIVRKIAHYMGDVMEGETDKLHESLLVNGYSMASYLTKFQWDLAKYSTNQPIKNISDFIAKQMTQIESDLKARSAAYNNLKGNLQILEKKSTGSLLTRNLSDLVKKEDFVLGSDYLITILIVVPRSLQKDFLENYETICDMIIPRSAKEIIQDNDNILYAVTVFRKVLDEFKLHAREKKFIVRDFVYNEEEMAAGKTEISKLASDKKKQFGPLVRWLRVNFSESYTAYIHVKALRVYVESVLRYGLPVNFQPMLLAAPKKNHKKLRDVLNQMYMHLDNSGTSNMDLMDIPGVSSSTAEYFPYVFYRIYTDITTARH